MTSSTTVGGQFPEILVEHRTPTLRGQATVAENGHPQHQRIASDRQVSDRVPVSR